jgi:transposase-like protein
MSLGFLRRIATLYLGGLSYGKINSTAKEFFPFEITKMQAWRAVYYFLKKSIHLAKLNEQIGITGENIRYAAFDGKWVSLNGKSFCILLFIDIESGYCLDFAIATGDYKPQVLSFLQRVCRLFPLLKPEVVVTDLKGGYREATNQVFPKASHQICGAHIFSALHNYIGLTWKRKYRVDPQKAEFEKAVFKYLNAETMDQLNESLRTLEKLSHAIGGGAQKAYRSLLHNAIRYFQWTKHGRLVKTNNMTEFIISQVNRRLKTIRGFGNSNMMVWVINALFLEHNLSKFREGKRQKFSPINLLTKREFDFNYLDALDAGERHKLFQILGNAPLIDAENLLKVTENLIRNSYFLRLY